ncbi:CAP domain-containing protein [Sphingomicrobium marinum]|uniref:CAP domain-containing protein n=1 Tax=Sphingomicrobium marinum TaxID=1227950 RepID=UPI00223F1282|nr:CAP domain-containing protein [Sphingomicrobium marinum]
MIARVLSLFVLVPLLSQCAAVPPPSSGYPPSHRERVSGGEVQRGDFRQVMLSAHNDARSRYGSAPLVWDRDLEASAHAYAREMARTGVFRHDPSRERRRVQGENIWMGTRGAFSYQAMIGSMIDERRYFRRGVFPDNSTTGRWQDVGHYTQIIWPQTTRVGCAIASNSGHDYLVCRYSPPGNIDGRAL